MKKQPRCGAGLSSIAARGEAAGDKRYSIAISPWLTLAVARTDGGALNYLPDISRSSQLLQRDRIVGLLQEEQLRLREEGFGSRPGKRAKCSAWA
jgi:hypothetical protein